MAAAAADIKAGRVMTALGPQIWVADGPPEPPVRPISEELCGLVKPHGGLWTSTRTDDDASDWIRWCVSEDFHGPSFRLWQLDPDPDAHIYMINDLEDLLRLCRRFPPICDHGRSCERYRLSTSELWVGWRRVADIYDAVHLTEDGQWATRLSLPANLYGWDCESTLWFRWRFTAIHDLGERTFSPREMAS